MHMRLTPAWLRVEMEVPIHVGQAGFQKGKVAGGVNKDFGSKRGEFEFITLPDVHYGFKFANDTNMPVYTGVVFVYAEYIVSIEKDPDRIYDVLTRRIPHYWFTMPVKDVTEPVKGSIMMTWELKKPGFPVPKPGTPRAEALRAIREVVG